MTTHAVTPRGNEYLITYTGLTMGNKYQILCQLCKNGNIWWWWDPCFTEWFE